MLLREFTFFAALLLSNTSFAQQPGEYFVNGNKLHEICQSANRATVTGYVVGLVDTLALVSEFDNQRPRFCFGRGVEAGQLADVLCKFLNDNPQSRTDSGAGLASVAFTQAWPCR